MKGSSRESHFSCFGKIDEKASRRVTDKMDSLSVDDGKMGTLKESVIMKTTVLFGFSR